VYLPLNEEVSDNLVCNIVALGCTIDILISNKYSSHKRSLIDGIQLIYAVPGAPLAQNGAKLDDLVASTQK
jgi:hypothetical protein